MDGHTILVERELYIYMYIYLYCSSFDYAALLLLLIPSFLYLLNEVVVWWMESVSKLRVKADPSIFMRITRYGIAHENTHLLAFSDSITINHHHKTYIPCLLTLFYSLVVV